MVHPPTQEPRSPRLAALLGGCFLVTAFFALDQTSNTITVQFANPWDASTRGELYFWLAAVFFLLPGAALIGVSFAPTARSALARMAVRLAASTRRERGAILVALTAVSGSLAWLGNQLILHGQPFTDDEGAARFGGEVLATGALTAPLPPMRYAFPELFLFQRDGHWTSFDFLGALLPWSFADLTGTETLIFALFACLVAPAVAVVCARVEGTAVGMVAGLLTLCSPMMLTLSITSHAHVVSRGLLSVGLALVLFLPRPSLRRSVAAGAVLGLAFAVRSPEVTVILAPLLIAWTWDAWRDPATRPRLLGLALGALPFVAIVLAYNVAIAGSLGFLRSAANEITVPYHATMRGPFAPHRLWPRFGNNLAYNLLTLAIWFFGPIGLVLAGLGARASRTHTLLGLSVLSVLALSLLHDDRGLHMVGPIHLSEAAIPLSILAAAGFGRARRALTTLGVTSHALSMALLGYAALGLVTFAGWHARALHRQALGREVLTALVHDVPTLPAVVLSPPFAALRAVLTVELRDVGGFVFAWRRARPDLSDAVLILHDSERARREVGTAFPDRTAYVFDPGRLGMKPVPLAAAESAAR